MARHSMHFTVSIKTPTGERGLRVKARDGLQATRLGIARLNIKDHEIPASGLEVKVVATT